MNLLRLCLLCLLAVCVLPCGGVSSARAQCTPVWQPFDPSTASLPGINGTVQATTMWDPDGPGGPQAPKLVVGGSFTIVGNVGANYIAAYDPATGQWSPLGSGMSGDFPVVRALAVLPNGDLVAGGSFNAAGGGLASNIARWNGSAWSPLGSGMAGGSFVTEVRALAVLPNGDLVAGGDFTTAGGVNANFIARWNGSAWSPLGLGVGNILYSLAVLPNGDLVAGGNFTGASGQLVNSIARWDGSAWSPLGSGVGGTSSPFVLALAVLPNGNLVAGGFFTTAGGVNARFIARWDGSAWSPLGSGVGGVSLPYVASLAVLPNGDLVAGGEFTTAGGQSASRVARWNGSAWSALGSGMNGIVVAMTELPNGDLVAGGEFTTAGGVVAPSLARWGCPPPTACGPSDVAGVNQSIGADGSLTADDIIVFLGWFFAGDLRADVAGQNQSSTPDGQFTADDIIVFLGRYFAGC